MEQNKLRKDLINAGFDFSLIGSIYLQELLNLIIEDPMLIFSLTKGAITTVAEKYNKNTSSVDRDVRWAIKKAHDLGYLKNGFKPSSKMPTTKQVLVWLLDKYLDY